jgi:predicted membrane protein
VNPAPPRMHLPSLAIGLGVMLAGTLYPPLMSDSHGRADHTLVLLVMWAMSAGFVRGVGFVPKAPAWRALFSGWAVLAAVLAALAWRGAH